MHVFDVWFAGVVWRFETCNFNVWHYVDNGVLQVRAFVAAC